MLIIAAVAVAAITFVIAAWAVGREAQRLGRQRLMPVYRLEEAVSFVAERLTYDVGAQTSASELREVLREHTNVLQFDKGAAADVDAEPVLVGGESVTAGLYRRVRGAGMDVTKPQLDEIVRHHLDYLLAIGAIGAVN